LLPAAELQQFKSAPKASTILRAFYEALPSVEKAEDFDETLGDHNSSSLVSETVPPNHWEPIDVSHYVTIAEAYLSRPAVKAALEAHYAPSLEPTFRVRREADVAAYSAIHLTHAVNHALGAIFPRSVEMVNEYQAGKETRTDCAWRAWNAKQGSFAMLELKIYEAIQKDEFDDTMLTTEESRKIEAEAAKDGVNLHHYKAASLFDSTSALSVIKQITCYAHSESYDTRYVGLFDINYLFLGVFEQSPRPKERPLLKGTLVPCQGAHGTKARRALLGWLLEARDKKQRGQNHHVPRAVKREQPQRGGKV
jgi:hypothetical protein